MMDRKTYRRNVVAQKPKRKKLGFLASFFEFILDPIQVQEWVSRRKVFWRTDRMLREIDYTEHKFDAWDAWYEEAKAVLDREPKRKPKPLKLP